MTPARLLQTLRQRGYSVGVGAAGLVVRGPKPKDAAGTEALLRANKAGLLRLLELEAHPLVAAAVEALGARLVDVRQVERPGRSDG